MEIGQVFFLLFLLQISYAAEICHISMCSNDDISVRFPFRIAGQQLQDCGYPGFDLRCDDKSKTVLKLPSSGDFLVREINYLAQVIQLYDPDNCLPKRLLHFNLSGSPFFATFYQNYTFLSCPTEFVKSRFITIDCLSNSTTSVLATSSMSLASSMSTVCKIINTVPVPVPWPVQYDGFSNALNDDLQLTWYSPDCSECETQGSICAFQGNSSKQISCLNTRGRSSSGLTVFKVICLSIAIPAILMAIGIALFAYFTDRRSTRGQGTINPLQNNTTAVAPQPAIGVMGLDESTIESYEKMVLGESKRMPRPNDGTCPICLSEYRSKEIIRCIPECKHCFHADCIDEWLRLKGTCPVCRNSPSPPRAES